MGNFPYRRSNPDHFNALFLGDKESKKKQKSPASTGSASQVVVMRELKWDHQVSAFCDKKTLKRRAETTFSLGLCEAINLGLHVCLWQGSCAHYFVKVGLVAHLLLYSSNSLTNSTGCHYMKSSA